MHDHPQASGGCLTVKQLRRVVTREASEAEEAAAVAHLGECPMCQEKLDTVVGETDVIPRLQQMHHDTTVGVEQARKAFLPLLPNWQDRGSYVELTPGLRLGPPRAPQFVASLGRFEIVGILGRGGMGYVVEGFDPQLQRPVAIKLMKPELSSDEAARARFLREARSAARLQHSNIVTIYEVSSDSTPAFFVMECIRGKSLASVIGCEGRLAPARAAHIVLEVLAALAHAHGEGIIHRDVKPANVLLDARVAMAKLADFGLARGVDDAIRYTREGGVVGTPWYVAPEQASGWRDLDGRCDLFSTGVMLFEMLTGALPFTGRDRQEVLERVCFDPAPDPRRLNPDVPPALAAVVDDSLQKEPAKRLPSAAAFAERLRAFLGEQPMAPLAETEEYPASTSPQETAVLTALLEMTQRRPPFQGRVWIEWAGAGCTRDILTVTRDNRDVCSIGEKFTLQAQADVNCYVTLIDVGSSGAVCTLTLNHPIRGGDVVTLTGPDDRHEWVVGKPPGVERIKALFTRQPLALTAAAFQPLAASGQTRDIVTRIKQVGSTLQAMPPDAWTDATCQFVVEPAE